MKAALALTFACLLFANGVLGAGGLNAYQPSSSHGGRTMLALLPGLATGGGSSGSSSTGSGSTGSNKTSSSGQSGSGNVVLMTTVAFAEDAVACLEWQPDTGKRGWDWPTKRTEFTATGSTVPPAADVEKLTNFICSDPKAAGDEIRTAVQAGGSQAQTAFFAIFAADCEDKADEAYGFAIDCVDIKGDPALVEEVSSWFTNFAAAADQVGIPVCLSLALVDMGTQEAVEERTFHVTGPPRGACKGSKGSSGRR